MTQNEMLAIVAALRDHAQNAWTYVNAPAGNYSAREIEKRLLDLDGMHWSKEIENIDELHTVEIGAFKCSFYWRAYADGDNGKQRSKCVFALLDQFEKIAGVKQSDKSRFSRADERPVLASIAVNIPAASAGVVDFASNDELRPVMTAVCLDPDGWAIASDAKTLAVFPVPVSVVDPAPAYPCVSGEVTDVRENAPARELCPVYDVVELPDVDASLLPVIASACVELPEIDQYFAAVETLAADVARINTRVNAASAEAVAALMLANMSDELRAAIADALGVDPASVDASPVDASPVADPVETLAPAIVPVSDPVEASPVAAGLSLFHWWRSVAAAVILALLAWLGVASVDASPVAVAVHDVPGVPTVEALAVVDLPNVDCVGVSPGIALPNVDCVGVSPAVELPPVEVLADRQPLPLLAPVTVRDLASAMGGDVPGVAPLASGDLPLVAHI